MIFFLVPQDWILIWCSNTVKYSKNSNIVKYYYNFKYFNVFSNVIYFRDGKAEFSSGIYLVLATFLFLQCWKKLLLFFFFFDEQKVQNNSIYLK